MSTVASFLAEDHYFGRNFDSEKTHNETVVIAPNNYSFKFRQVDNIDSHYAIIGMATVVDDYPLFYEACNEKGLAMAELTYYEADYKELNENTDNIAPFELIPWILCQCETVKEALELIKKINLLNINFNEEIQLSPLHWMISDKNESMVVECEATGLKVYYNPARVLTNSPSFDKQYFNLNNYRHVSSKIPRNNFSENLELDVYSRGMGSIGLPGDYSSTSRFVKVAFTLQNVVIGSSEEENVSQFFHILGSVTQQRGCSEVAQGQFDYTIYTSCINTDKGIYYYKTYYNSQINAIGLYDHDLTDDELVIYPLNDYPQINYQSSKKEEYMFN